MRLYSVVYTPLAKDDIVNAADYIANTLMDQYAANRLIDGVERTTERLKVYPESAPLVGDDALCARGVRAATVLAYILFYQVNEESKTIRVVRFLHSTQDCANLLLQE